MGAADLTLDESRFPARDRLNSRLVKEVLVRGPVSYPVGGVTRIPAALSFSEIYSVYGILYGDIGFGVIPIDCAWSYPTQALLLFFSGAEATEGLDLSMTSGTLLITGKG